MQYRSEVTALFSRDSRAVSIQPMLGSRQDPDELTCDYLRRMRASLALFLRHILLALLLRSTRTISLLLVHVRLMLSALINLQLITPRSRVQAPPSQVHLRHPRPLRLLWSHSSYRSQLAPYSNDHVRL